MEKEIKNNQNRKIILPILILIITLIATISVLAAQPLIISNVEPIDVWHDYVIINWETNNPANTNLFYRTAEQETYYEYFDTSLLTNHTVQIIGLDENTTYYYYVSSTDANDNQKSTKEYNVTTKTYQENPKYYDITTNPDTQIIYETSQNYKFSVLWDDDKEINQVQIHHNFSGTPNALKVNATENVYIHTVQEISAGNYFWYMTATDKDGNQNQTPKQTYVVQKATPALNLLLNGNEQNITIQQYEKINFTGITDNDQGILKLTINGEEYTNKSKITKIIQFTEPGTIIAKLEYQENQNYTQKIKEFTITIQNTTFSIATSKTNYNLNEQGQYTVYFPNKSEVELEICGPVPENGGFVECYTQTNITNTNSPKTKTHTLTKKQGNYIIYAQTKIGDETLQEEIEYTVDNSILIDVDGEKTILKGDTIDLLATASEGISPYTYKWKLSNGTKIENRNLEIKYDTKGTYETILTITDAQGNNKTQSFDITVKNSYDVTIILKDKETNKYIPDANIDLGDETGITDSNGKAIIKVAEGKNDLKITAEKYNRISTELDIASVKTYTYELTKKENDDEIKITLKEPANNEKTSTNPHISAEIETSKETSCELYIKKQADSWSKVEKTWTISKNTEISHIPELEDATTYDWSIICENENRQEESPSQKFTTTGTTSTFSKSSTTTSNDPGELRQKIEESLDNLNSLDIQLKRAAESMQLIKKVELALRDYDRVLRDINNIQFRTDLTDEQKFEKKDEYNSKLSEIEKTTPYDLQIEKTEEQIKYPKKEELREIITQYAETLKKTDTINDAELQDIQNKLLVKTKISTGTITYTSGKTEDITLIEKEITLTNNKTKGFILEYIPKELEQSAENINFITNHQIIKSDPLIRFETEEKIVYVIKGKKDLENAKEAISILYEESIFAKSKNGLTGNITLANLDLESPIFLIILLLIIITLYAAYSFGAYDKIIELTGKGNSNNKILDKIRTLIIDAKEKAETYQIDQAQIILKEIRTIYEKSNQETKSQIYQEASNIIQIINAYYLVKLVNESKDLEEDKEKIMQTFQMINEEYEQILPEEILQKIQIIKQN
ncbi:hypothetical protein K9L67_04980 [Candidatus Woesearchaeota archaeon]|nr:hypothetical protein [Candidatus Woesearchaeota archaeon]MCF7901551.1 hypothetical protein [Candidatus Woesearchaeota archaeon]